MKKILYFYKKVLAFFIAVIFSFLCVSVRSHAELPDVEVLGGSYGAVVHQGYDHRKFHVHHLISKEAWRRLGKGITFMYGVYPYNEFITCDDLQEWAPAILMEKEDHAQTRSYYSPDRPAEVNAQAKAHINYETDELYINGAVIQLLKAECDDIRAKFGHKYDKAISQMYASIKGQFSHQGDLLVIHDLSTDCYARCRFGNTEEICKLIRWVA